MKKIVPFLLLLSVFSVHPGAAQPWNEVRILHVDTQHFPTVHVKVRAWCAGQQSSNINPVNVRITENGMPRVMTTLNCPMETVPISVALALDRSGSVAGTSIFRVKLGAMRFVELLRAHSTGTDEAAVFSFGDDVIKHVGMTTNLNALFAAIDGIYPYGVTTMYDAVIEALNEVHNNGANGIKAVIVLSDGADNNSFATASDCIALAQQHGIAIFSIGVGYDPGTSDLPSMRKLADSTGGKFLLIEHPDDVIPAFDAMASLVSSGANDCDMQYVSDCPDGSWRELTVIAEACGLADTSHVRFRAPLDPNLPAFNVSFDSTFAYENGELRLPISVEAEGGGGTLDFLEFKVVERPPLRFVGIETQGMLAETMTVNSSIVGDSLIVGVVGPAFVSGKQTLLTLRYATPPLTADTTFIYPVFSLRKRTQDCLQLKARNTYLTILKRPVLDILCDDTLYVDWDEQLGSFVNDLVTVGVSVRNNGNLSVENTRVRLTVPEGMELLSAADSVLLPVNPLPPKGSGYVDFRVRVLPREETRTYELCIEVVPDSGLPVTCCRTVIVERARTILEADCSMPYRIEWSDSLGRYVPDRFPVSVHVRNRSELRAEQIAAWIHVPPGFVVDSLTPVNTVVSPSQLGRNDTGSVTWWVRPLERPTSDLVRLCVKVAAGPDTAICCQDIFITASPVRALMRCTDTRMMVYDDGTGQYEPPRMLIATTMQNVSALGMGKTRGTIQLPPFLQLDHGEFASKDFPNSGVIAAGDSGTISWIVIADGQPSVTSGDICVSVTAENFPGAQCCTPVRIDLVNAIPVLECDLSGPDTVVYVDGGYDPNPITLDLFVRNTGDWPATRLHAALLQGADVSIDASDRALKLISDSLAIGKSVTASFRVRILDRNVARLDTIRVSVFAENGGATMCEIPVFIEAVRGPVLELQCSGPDTLIFSDALGHYEPAPFQIQLEALNSGTAPADSVVAEFLPPPDIILETGETAAKLLVPSTLGVGESGTASWLLRAVPRDVARLDTIRVQVKARGKTLQQTAPCEIPVYIPAARTPAFALDCQVTREAGSDDTVVVAAGVTNTSDAALFDVTVRVSVPGKLRLAPGTQPLERTIPVIQPGEAVRLFAWSLTLQRGVVLDSVDVCFTAEARFVPPQTCCTSVRIPPADVASFAFDCALAPDTIRVDTLTGAYGETTFSVTLTNPTSVVLDSVRCSLVLPAGVVLVAGERDERIVRNLRPGTPQTVSWRLTGVRDTSTVHRTRSIRVELVGAGAAERCTRILLLAPPPPMPMDFILSCSAPDTIRYLYETGQYEPAPFTLRVDITNTGSTLLRNLRATLTPAAEIVLDAGEAPTKSLGVDLAPGQMASIAWSCRGLPQPATVAATSRIHVEADGAGQRACDPTTVLYREVRNDSLGMEIACVAPDTIRYRGRNVGWEPSPMSFSVRVTNTGTLPIANAHATGLLPENFVLADGETAMKPLPALIGPGETVVVTWFAVPMATASPDRCLEVLVTVPGLPTRSCVRCIHVEPPYDIIQLSIPDNNVGMMGETLDIPIDLLNPLALPLKDFTLLIAYDPLLVAIDAVEQAGTLTRSWPAVVIDHPRPDAVRLHFAGDTPLLASGVLALLRCHLRALSGHDGDFGVFESRLAFVSDALVFEPGIAAMTIDGRVYSAGNCVVPLDAQGSLQVANRPNPFNPITVIQWHVPDALAGVRGSLTVLDLHGRVVARLHDGALVAGSHEHVFNADVLPSGIYLCRLEAAGTVITRKMLLAR
ncbi:MAG: VWA domain-containing protein [Bacteroidota bacterium]|jgi:uncharacterized protein YegL|nr:VWA domain-containing protein [Bacteroidota bacterium]